MQVALDRMSEALRCSPHFPLLHELCSATEMFLAGGAIRDALVGRTVTDLDLICPTDPTSLARSFARKIGGSWFWLDRERLQSRVVVNHDENCPNYDFALFRAPTLEQDLLDRDFTINAMALPLSATLPASSLIDPCGGLDALRQGSLRMVGEESMANDPLRIIKGVRHATTLGLEIEVATLKKMQSEAAELDRVAAERVRQEVWKIFADRQAERGLRLLVASGAGAQLFGADLAGKCQALAGRLKSCREQWQRLAQVHPCVLGWLQQEVEQGLSCEAMLLFAFLLSDVEKGLPERLANKWKLSRNATEQIALVAGLDAGVLQSFSAIARNQRAYAWWAWRLHGDPRGLLLALAGHPQADTIASAIDELTPLIAGLDCRRPKDLVDGRWLRDELRLADGPEMNRALTLLREAEIFGEVNNREEACRFLASHYQNRD